MVANAEVIDDEGDEVITRRTRDSRLEPLRLTQLIRRANQFQAARNRRDMLFMDDFVEQIHLGLSCLFCRMAKTKPLLHILKHHEVCHALVTHEEFQRNAFHAHLLKHSLFCLKVNRLGIGNDAVHIVDKCLHENASIRASAMLM